MIAMPPPKSKFTMSDGDLASGMWDRLARQLRARLGKLRARNDNPLSADQTAFVRGQIDILKDLLRLEKRAAASDQIDDGEDDLGHGLPPPSTGDRQ